MISKVYGYASELMLFTLDSLFTEISSCTYRYSCSDNYLSSLYDDISLVTDLLSDYSAALADDDLDYANSVIFDYIVNYIDNVHFDIEFYRLYRRYFSPIILEYLFLLDDDDIFHSLY